MLADCNVVFDFDNFVFLGKRFITGSVENMNITDMVKFKADSGTNGIDFVIPQHLLRPDFPLGPKIESRIGKVVTGKVNIDIYRLNIKIGYQSHRVEVGIIQDLSTPYALCGSSAMNKFLLIDVFDNIIQGHDTFIDMVDIVGNDRIADRIDSGKFMPNKGKSLPYSVKKRLRERKEMSQALNEKFLNDEIELTDGAGTKLDKELIKQNTGGYEHRVSLIHSVVEKTKLKEDEKIKLKDMLVKHNNVLFGFGKFNGFEMDVQLKPNSKCYSIKSRSKPKSPLEVATETPEIESLQKLDVIEDGDSFGFVGHVVFVPKKDNSLRFCGNFRELNKNVLWDNYSFPDMSTVVNDIAGYNYLIQVDITAAFWQIPIKKDKRHLFQFHSVDGLKQYKRTPMGFLNSTQTMQRAMDFTCRGLQKTKIYADDITIGGDTVEECLENFGKFLERINQFGWTIKLEKCIFFPEETDILGYTIRPGVGYKVPHKKCDAVLKQNLPKTVNELQRFIGLINVYFKRIPSFAYLIAPLNKKVSKNYDEILTWSDWEIQCFNNLKKMIIQDIETRSIVQGTKKIVRTDASSIGMGVVLCQERDGELEICQISSKLFIASQKKYPAWQKELLAIHYALKKYRHYLLGEQVVVQTDCIALKSMFDSDNALINRWIQVFAEFNISIEHVSGKKLIDADWASRLEHSEIDQEIIDSLPDIELVIDAFDTENFSDEWVKLFNETEDAKKMIIEQLSSLSETIKLDTFQKTPRKPRYCSYCKGLGHDSRNCRAKINARFYDQYQLSPEHLNVTPNFTEMSEEKDAGRHTDKAIGSAIREQLENPPPIFNIYQSSPLDLRVWEEHISPFRHIGKNQLAKVIDKEWLDLSEEERTWAKRRIDEIIDQCVTCQIRRAARKSPKGSPIPQPYNSRPSSGLITDNSFLGTLQMDQYSWIELNPISKVKEKFLFLTIIDVATQMLVVIHIENETSVEAWNKFLKEFVLKWGFPLKIRIDSKLGKVDKTTGPPSEFVQGCVDMRIAVENRISHDPKSLGLVEHMNHHIGLVFERLYEENLSQLHPQEKANIAAFEWNNSIKSILNVCPNELVFGQRLCLSTAQLYRKMDNTTKQDRAMKGRLNAADRDKLRQESVLARRKRALHLADKSYVENLQKYLPIVGDWVYILKDENKWANDKALMHKSNRPWEGPYRVLEPDDHASILTNGDKKFSWPNNRLRLWRSRNLHLKEA